MADKPVAKKIPDTVVEAVEELSQALDTLNHAVVTRLPAVAREETPRARAADVVLDAAWSGLYDVLGGWSKISGLPESEIATSLRATLYPNKLKFTQIAFMLEWAESNTRIQLIKERGLDAEIKKLGAGKILEKLYEAHREYGEALGVTSPAEVAPVPERLREALVEIQEALRIFVVRASGMISKKDPSKSEIAKRLLAPIEAWETPAPRAAAPAPDPTPSPAPTPAPEPGAEGAPGAAKPAAS